MPVAQESIPPAENVGPAQRKKKKKKLVWSRLLMVEMALKKKKISYDSQTRVIENQ